MLTGRSSAVALFVLVAALSFETLACSQPSEEAAGDTQAISADGLLTIDPSLPFEVARVHVANGPVLGAAWGAHNGPLVTSQNFSAPSEAPSVTRWFVPTAAGAPMSQQPWKTLMPSDMPTGHFWGSFVPMPFGSVTFQSYSGTGEHFPGEVFLFSSDYDTIIARAKANGFFSGVGVTDGTKNRIVYSGLSGFSAEASTVDENGIWASDVTAASLTGGSLKLFGWNGASGPVVLDNSGNLFVAARRNDAEHKTAIFALTKGQTFATDAVQQATINEGDTTGTASLAVASVPSSGKGWIFAKGFDDAAGPAPVYARAYTTTADAIASEGDVIPAAIKATQATSSLTVFGDPSGNLWVAVEGDAGAWLIQLKPKSTP